MLSKFEKDRIVHMEKLREALKEQGHVLNIAEASVSGVPSLACLNKAYWEERDRFLKHLRQLAALAKDSMKDVDRQIGKIYGRGEIKATGTQ